MAGHPRGGGRGTPVAVPPPLQRALLSCLQPPGWSGAQAAPRISSRIVAASTAPADAAGVESVPDAPPPPSADEVAQAAKKHNRCVAYIDYALARSPFVKFMTRALEQAGCPFSREHFICEPCDNRNLAGGFVPTGASPAAVAGETADGRPLIPRVHHPLGCAFGRAAGVVLCENHSLSQSDVNDVVTHELIHAFDHCRAKVDWDDCVHHACSEIRAANLSGDCFFGKEVRRMPAAPPRRRPVSA